MRADRNLNKKQLATKSLEIIEKLLLNETNLGQLQHSLAARDKALADQHMSKGEMVYAKRHGTKVTLNGRDFYVSRTLGKIANDIINYIKTPDADPVLVLQTIYSRCSLWLVKTAKAAKHDIRSSDPLIIASSYANYIYKDQYSLPQHKVYAALYQLTRTLISMDRYDNPEVFDTFFSKINSDIKDLVEAQIKFLELKSMLPPRPHRVSEVNPQAQANVEEIPKLHPKILINDLTVVPDENLAVARLKADSIAESIYIKDDTYHLYKNGKLGEGAFGEVWLAQNQKSGEWLALKKIHNNNQKIALDEINNLQKSNQHVFSVLHNNHFYIGMKLHPGLDLFEVNQAITNNKMIPLNQAQQLLIAKRILKKAADIHNAKEAIVDPKKKQIAEKMLHRDIKPENMLMDEQLNIQIIDYGFAVKIESKDKPVKDIAKGSPLYMGREIYDRTNRDVSYGEKSEVYALGVSLWDLTDSKGLVYQYDDGYVRPAIDVMVREKGQDSLQILLHDMVQEDPSLRPTVNQCYSRINAINNQYARDSKQSLKVYAIDIHEYQQALYEGKLPEYLDQIKQSGANAIAFVGRVRDTLTQEELVNMHRVIKELGFLQVASKVQYGKSALDVIKNEHNAMFGTTNVEVTSSQRAMQEANSRTSQAGVFSASRRAAPREGDDHKPSNKRGPGSSK